MPHITFYPFKFRRKVGLGKPSATAPALAALIPDESTLKCNGVLDANGTPMTSPSSGLGLLSLPPEILLMIAARISKYRDLNALVQSHRRLATILSSVLYRRALSPGPDGYGASFLLHSAICSGTHTRLRILLTEYGVDPNARLRTDYKSREQTSLHLAVSLADVTSARILLDAGANVNAADSTLTTPLHIASRSANVEMIILLLSHGANLDAVDCEDLTPLHTAVSSRSNNRLFAAMALLGFGAKPNATVHITSGLYVFTHMSGWSPLHLAAASYFDPESMIRLLVEHGADLEQALLNIDAPGTPLALVAAVLVWCVLKTSRALRSNAKYVDKESPEHWKAVKVLLELGADIEPALQVVTSLSRGVPRETRLSNGTEFTILTYLGLLASPTWRLRRYSFWGVSEEEWKAAGQTVRAGLERARDRVKGVEREICPAGLGEGTREPKPVPTTARRSRGWLKRFIK